MANTFTFSNISLLSAGATTRGHRVIMSEMTMGAADYLAAGIAVNAATFGLRNLKKVYGFDVAVTGAAGAQYEPTWDKTAGKIKIQVAATGVEAANNLAALNGLTWQLIAVGS